MGGIGSGTWCRWGSRTTVDKTSRVDIRYMRKQGLLKTNMQGTLSWSCNGEPSGSIGYRVYEDYLHLDFNYRSHDSEEWQPVKQQVMFTYTPCYYGGTRRWLVCPHCQRRVEILCLYGPRFLCRHCHQLPYSSQNEDHLERLRSKRDKLGKRIFEDYRVNQRYGLLKKKGMHWKTFERLKQEFYELAENYESTLVYELEKGVARLYR